MKICSVMIYFLNLYVKTVNPYVLIGFMRCFMLLNNVLLGWLSHIELVILYKHTIYIFDLNLLFKNK